MTLLKKNLHKFIKIMSVITLLSIASSSYASVWKAENKWDDVLKKLNPK